MGELASDRYGLVLLLLLTTYILSSTLPESGASQALIIAIQGVTVLVALAASQVRFRVRRIAAGLAALSVVAGAASASAGGVGFGVAELISAVLMAVALGSILRRIATHESVSVQTLLGAIDAYVLFGLIYAFAYSAIGRIGSSAFFQSGAHESISNFLFFSYVTLTTTGYGNLVPAGQFAQTIAVIEALTGQLFLVTVVARLVALWRSPR
jgi:Ion channel